ncbi:hypothetical protein D1AOALGA4SA_217 [Olavius algarvensis Delta 1 endosymbiont]|nr:hypothetical protein D1AOALGA4SA_217 [Olavius algarvensis Delta 1 endosymbiont]
MISGFRCQVSGVRVIAIIIDHKIAYSLLYQLYNILKSYPIVQF